MDPQQELFTAVKLSIEGLGYRVYDGFLPDEGAEYPFVHLGELRQTDRANKSAVFGRVLVNLHVWSAATGGRGRVSEMLLKIKTALRKISDTKNFAWSLGSLNQRVLADDSTRALLLHGVIEAEYQFS